jgi:hypothetical protein
MPSGTTKRPHPIPPKYDAEHPRPARHHWWQRRTTH